jgi:hypothetical protein
VEQKKTWTSPKGEKARHNYGVKMAYFLDKARATALSLVAPIFKLSRPKSSTHSLTRIQNHSPPTIAQLVVI